MQKDSKVFVAGGTGLVGLAIVGELLAQGYTNVVANYHSRQPTRLQSHFQRYVDDGSLTIRQLDCMSVDQVNTFMEEEKPEYLFLAAARVGGILANHTYRAQFIYENLQIQNTIIHASWQHGVKKLIFLASSCIYPKLCPQPMREEHLLSSELEYTNEPYALAKIAGMRMCESYNLQYGTNFLPVMPSNLYGFNDNFDLKSSHVLPAIIRKLYLGKLLMENRHAELLADLCVEHMDEANNVLDEVGIKPDAVTLWGTGSPRREFLHAQDMASACIHVINNVNFAQMSAGMKEVRNTHINIGCGEDISIKGLAHLIKDAVGYEGDLIFDASKPDGTPRKVMDTSRLTELGWTPSISLEEGVRALARWYADNSGALCR